MDRSLSALAPRVRGLPGSGDEVFHFRLGRELGRGAFARVFLAEQADLAGRRVVVKCSTIEGNEPQTLAQLQHTNIVPIYSVHENPDAGLRAVCMPYFGGATFAQVLQMAWNKTGRPVRGEELVQALLEVQGSLEEPAGARDQESGVREQGAGAGSSLTPDPCPLTPEGGGRYSGQSPLDLLKGLSYVQAVAWITARLADGLQHAHQRGVLHHDIKPSNILIGADGQPMLLDFNLARWTRDEASCAAALLGGTVAYMAPEHLRAMTSKDADLHRRVDHRSDIYALGMVLFEALSGQGPFAQRGSYSALPILLELMAMERMRALPSVRQKRPDVPWSLESILRKCLAPDPLQRYQQAGHLAVDLRRFLESQPLRFAPELSNVERLQKWFRRHPRLTSGATVMAVACVFFAGTAGSLVGIRQHLTATQKQLEAAQAQERKRTFEAGVQRALCLVNTTADLRDHLREGQQVCREALALYSVLERDDWQEQPAWHRLDPPERQRLGEDVRELLLLLAWAGVRTSPEDQGALKQALALLEKAEGVQGLPPSRALLEDRALYLERTGDTAGARAAREQAARVATADVRDRYLLATSFARSGRYREAVAELNEALRQNPRHYWSAFQRGICHQELGKHALASGDFGVCIGLWPEFALGYFNRGYSLDQVGDKAEAIRDYTAALARDPTLAPAYLNRGMACLELKRYEEALADFDKVAELGSDDPFLHAGRGVALEGLGKFSEADSSFAAAFTRARTAPEEVGLRIRWVYGFSVCSRLPEKAQAAFLEVLARDGAHPQAHYGLAMLLAEKGQLNEALDHLNKAVEASPGFAEARRCRAVLQARRGNLALASEEINACLAKAPDSGAVLYAAACVAAWVAKKSPDALVAANARAQALGLLERAFRQGYGLDKAAGDPDLAGLHGHPAFERLLKNTGKKKE